MPTRYLSDADLARLSGYPETIADEDLVTYFRLGDEDLRWLRAEHRGAANRLGLALQLCTLGWLGFMPDDLSAAPSAAVQRLAHQLDVDPDVLASYGGWQGRTRRDHLHEVLERLGWRTAGTGELKALDDFLLARALEHDRPTLLVQLACDHLRAERVVRPGVEPLMRRVAAARERAWAETYERLQPMLFDPARRAALDQLLEPDPTLGAAPLVWLRQGATAVSAQAIKRELAKLSFLRTLGADRLDLSTIPVGRRRFLAGLGRRSRTQALARAAAPRRYPVLLATLAETAIEVLDELVELFDQALAGADRRARDQMGARALARAQEVEDRLELLDDLLSVLADPAIADEDVGRRLRHGIGMDRLQEASRPPGERRSGDAGHLELLEARYAHLREFTPAVLAALPLEAGPGASLLLAAVEVLRELNRSGRRHLPEEVSTEFVPARWRSYVDDPDANAAVRRHYWELAVLYGLQAALRSGDVWVPGSRRWSDPAASLIPAERWGALRGDFCQLSGMPADGEERLEQLDRELHAALDALEPVLAGEGGPVRLDTEGRIVVSPLSAEQRPPDAEALHRAVTQRLPTVDLAALLIEVDGWTGFTDSLTHAGRASHRPPELRRNLYAALLAQATNLGAAGMADAAGISEDALAWTTQWYLQAETLRAANTVLVNNHHRQPLARLWGGGTLSSSDGQRFPQRGRSLTARALSRYFVNAGTTTYTHVADQHSTYGTKVIPSTVRDATYVLDEILGNPTELPIAEHATDTAGQTLATFGVFDLLGLRFSPRIRDLPSLRLYRSGPASAFSQWPRAGRLLTEPIQRQLIIEHWDDLLRLAGSLKFGHATASLVLRRLHAARRHGSLARAVIEYGRLVRTIFVLRYLADDELRRRIGRQLNKGETLHSLRRALFFAHEGHVRHRHHEDQTEQALCLTIVTNAVVLWNTVYLNDAVEDLRREADVDDEVAAHLSPALVDHINPYGRFLFDVDRELTRTSRRPLRRPGSARSGSDPVAAP